jgi:hypothetical protein
LAYRPLFELQSFDELPASTQCKLVIGLVRSLVEVNRQYLLGHPATVPLYQSGVRYREQQTAGGVYTGIDSWWDIPACLEMGEGSCEDLAAWRVAEQQFRGKSIFDRQARPFVHSKTVGDLTVYHVVVRYPGNREEDPSVILGMWPPWSA